MNNRSPSSSTQETSSNYDYLRNLERAVVQTGAVTFFLGTAAYPLEYIANRKSMGMPITFSSFFSSAFLRANYSTIMPGLRKSYELCFMKNVAVSNHGRVTEFIGEAEGRRAGYYNIVAPSFGLALADTTATQPFANYRILLDAGKKKPILNWADYIKFARLGASTRFTGNFVNIVGCMGATNFLKRPITRFLPEEQFGVFLPSAITTILSGTLVGFSNHGLKVVNNRRVNAYDFDKKTAQGFIETLFNVAKKEGARGFTKGSLWSASITVLAYSIINSVDYVADYYYGGQEFSLFERNNKNISFDSPKKNIPQSIQPVSIPTNHRPVKIQIEDVTPTAKPPQASAHVPQMNKPQLEAKPQTIAIEDVTPTASPPQASAPIPQVNKPQLEAKPQTIAIEDVPTKAHAPQATAPVPQTNKPQPETKPQTNSVGHSSNSPRLFVLPPKQGESKAAVVEEVKTNRISKK